MIGMGGIARVKAMIENGRGFLSRAMLGRFECQQCGHPGPHRFVRVGYGDRFECASCEDWINRDDVFAALRRVSS